MSKLSFIKDVTMEVLADYQEHSAQELREEIQRRGLQLEVGSSTLRTALYQLKNSGINIESKERGVYCLTKQEEVPLLRGFSVLKPVDNSAKRCVYIHEDGKIVLNGRLNGEVISRKIEIRIADNGGKIALIEDGKDYHRFTKSGHTKNIEILKLLSKKKIDFPISYEMEKQDNIWIGNLKKMNTKKHK